MGVELFSYVDVLFCLQQISTDAGHVSENAEAMFTSGNPGSVMGPAFVWGKIQFYNLTFGFIEIAGNNCRSNTGAHF